MVIKQIKKTEQLVKQCATLICTNFKDIPEYNIAYNIANKSLSDDNNINLFAIDIDGSIVGWICGIEQYNVHIWEIQPLVVNKSVHGQGIGRKLIQAFEKEAALRGGITIIVGIQDEYNETSLSNTNMYEDTFEKIKNIKNLKNNPFEFYLKTGFRIVGVIPDSNGIGKPDILMAKKVEY